MTVLFSSLITSQISQLKTLLKSNQVATYVLRGHNHHYRRVVDMTDFFRRKGGMICFHLSPQITDEFMCSTSILVSGFLYENPVLIWVPHVSGPSWCSFNLIIFVELLSPQKTTSKVLAVKAVMFG